jgi:hypothetical protein
MTKDKTNKGPLIYTFVFDIKNTQPKNGDSSVMIEFMITGAKKKIFLCFDITWSSKIHFRMKKHQEQVKIGAVMKRIVWSVPESICSHFPGSPFIIQVSVSIRISIQMTNDTAKNR